LATLARSDLTYIRQHRGDHNRLGLAIQMVYLRHPSRVLPQNEAPFPPLLGIVAAQLKVTPAVWTQYARRDETRREHLQELLDRFELRQFDRSDYRALIDWLSPLALQTTQGMVLAHAVANELRTRHILLPTVAMIEKMSRFCLGTINAGLQLIGRHVGVAALQATLKPTDSVVEFQEFFGGLRHLDCMRPRLLGVLRL
jgi:TnpA family transposase